MPILTSIGGAVREVGRLPCGVNGVVREMDKAYGGIDGVTRELFSGIPQGAIYWEGDECASFTGGLWTAVGSYGSGAVVKLPSCIRITGEANANTLITTLKIIDLTKYTNLCAEVMIESAAADLYDEFSISVKTGWKNGFLPNSDQMCNGVGEIKITKSYMKGSKQIFKLNLSGVAPTHVLSIGTWYVAVGYVYKIWLE